jgi:hypothetical protein
MGIVLCALDKLMSWFPRFHLFFASSKEGKTTY